MTIREFHTSRATLERFHAEAQEARLVNAVHRLRFAAWLRDIADRLAAA